MILQKPVITFSDRGEYRPEIVVLHLGEGSANTIYQTFLTEEKSSHYLVCRNREIWQFVPEDKSAWTQGIKKNPTAKKILEKPDVNPNKFAISIENEGWSWSFIPETQYEDNADLVLQICEKWKIPLDRTHIIAHHEIRNDKRCPLPISVDKVLKIAQQKKAGTYEQAKLLELQRQLSVLWDMFRRLG